MSDGQDMGASQATGLSSPTEPSCTVSALTGFDPSRGERVVTDLIKIGWRDDACFVRNALDEISALRSIIADMSYCSANASLEFMRLIPAEIRATRAQLALLRPRAYTESLMVPETMQEMLGEIARIAGDYDLRASIEMCEPHDSLIFDSLTWRDCIEVANAIATEARRAETENTGSVHKGAGRQASPKPHPSGEQP